ncbi:hypothetical protein MIR68_010115 [Amoeboaphelidium protococcarum]|nr:hypothetical protein MIR68_010115 [Amoeboaphelidium protococcarum]
MQPYQGSQMVYGSQQQLYQSGSMTPQFLQQQKKAEPNKLSTFLQECLLAGCLKGFKHFELYLRGKEELLCRVYNDSASSKQKQVTTNAVAHSNSLKPFMRSKSFRMLLEQGSQVQPASPSDREIEKDQTKTAFLIAGYARYKRPYVWLRSNHSKLAKVIPEMMNNGTAEADAPVKLSSIQKWMESEVKLWEILSEVLLMAHRALNIQTDDGNPFAIDRIFFQQQNVLTGVIVSGAMIDFLGKIYAGCTQYQQSVLLDLEWLVDYHYSALKSIQQPVAEI